MAGRSFPTVDGHDPAAIGPAIDAALADHARPSLIVCQTVIGYGAPSKQGQAVCHGAPLGEDEIRLARERLGWPHPPFVVPEIDCPGLGMPGLGGRSGKPTGNRA